MIKQFSLMNNTKGLLWKNKILNLCHHRKYVNNIQYGINKSTSKIGDSWKNFLILRE